VESELKQLPLKGKTALVTGAAMRLGRAVALALADAGVNVVVHYRNAVQPAESLRALLVERGVRAFIVRADFEKPEEADSLMERARAEAGSIDILVNNASVFGPSRLEALTRDSLAHNMEVNAWVPFILTRALARQASNGKVVNFLDAKIAGLDLEHAGYILSKQLLATLTRMTAMAFAPNIAVNAVAPGLILPPEGKNKSYLTQLAKSVPLQRHGDVAEVTRAVLFLLQSNFITGQVIYLDGGWHLTGE
jgi:NAD(P)-dependent dehydrogenase (short-subunit alcohol dehydrogenase family)